MGKESVALPGLAVVATYATVRNHSPHLRPCTQSEHVHEHKRILRKKARMFLHRSFSVGCLILVFVFLSLTSGCNGGCLCWAANAQEPKHHKRDQAERNDCLYVVIYDQAKRNHCLYVVISTQLYTHFAVDECKYGDVAFRRTVCTLPASEKVRMQAKFTKEAERCRCYVP